jgi:hypothetical protein
VSIGPAEEMATFRQALTEVLAQEASQA